MRGRPLRLLAVLAHPDDESFGPGGTLARYAAEGVKVHLITATRGDAGVGEDQALNAGYATLAAQRVEELRCASETLGLAGLELLDYRDSGMCGSADNLHPCSLVRAPLSQVARQIQERIARLQPDVVVSHGPHGDYGHPDHIAVHLATSSALAQMRRQEGTRAPKFYSVTWSATAFALNIWLLRLRGADPRRFGANQDIDLLAVRDSLPPVTARIDVLASLDTKARASACHGSQGGGGRLARGLPRFIVKRLQRYEPFSRLYPPVRPGERTERDLFAGLR